MAKLTSCPNGHFYDADRWEQCPYCGQPEHTVPIFPGRPEDEGKTTPLESDPGKTMPLDEGKTVPLQEEVMNKTQPLNGADMDKTQPLNDAGAGRTVPLDEAPTAPPPLRREADWQRMLLLAAAGLAAASTLLSLIDMMILGTLFWLWPALADAVCCAAICLCCVWCVKTEGARPWPWLPIVLALVGIPAAFWALQRNYLSAVYYILLIPNRVLGTFRAVSLPQFLSFASKEGCLAHVLTRFASLAAAVLGPIAIFLYQRKMRKNS